VRFRPALPRATAYRLRFRIWTTNRYQTYCFLVEGGKARRTMVQTGARDSERVEVLKMQATAAKSGGENIWEDFTGDEDVILDNLRSIADGQPVAITPKP
jgi:hypothetical protein